MLNKQGIFNRRSQPEDPRTGVSGASSPVRPQEKLTPGHLAAMESATSPSTPVSAGPGETRTNHALAEQSKADGGGSRLIVGPDVKLKGAEIEDCDTLVVEGRVEATMDSRVIQITSNGSFSGKVGIDVAEIYGRFDGELTARSQLIIHASGRVSGKIRYGKIHIEEGGELSGDIGTLDDKGGSLGKLGAAHRLTQSSGKVN